MMRLTTIRSWLLALALGVGIFTAGQPLLAELLQAEEQLRQYLASKTVEVGAETVGGYQQVYYVYDGQRQYVTEGNQNSTDVVADGEYMAWVTTTNGGGQIFLHHIPTGNTVQLTHSSTNLNPTVSNNTVAWERWVGDRWQIFFFDGVRTVQLTEGDLAVEPQTTADGILFARKDDSGQWRAERYDAARGSIELALAGLPGKLLVLDGGQLAPPVPSPFPSPLVSERITPTATPSVPDETSTSEAAATPEPTPTPTPSPETSPLPEEPPTVTEEEIAAELAATPEPSPSPPLVPTPSPKPDLS